MQYLLNKFKQENMNVRLHFSPIGVVFFFGNLLLFYDATSLGNFLLTAMKDAYLPDKTFSYLTVKVVATKLFDVGNFAE